MPTKKHEENEIAEEISKVTNVWQFILVILTNPLMWIFSTITIVLVLLITIGDLRIGSKGFYFKSNVDKLTNVIPHIRR